MRFRERVANMNHDKVDTGYPPGLRSLWKARRLLPKWVWFYMLILAGVSLFLIEQIMVSWEWPADPYMLVVPGILIMGIPGAMIQGFGHLAGIELGSIARSETACQDPIKNEPFSPMVGSRFDVFRELSNSDMGILVGFFALAVVSCTGFIIQLRTYSFLVKAFPAWPLVFVLTVGLCCIKR